MYEHYILENEEYMYCVEHHMVLHEEGDVQYLQLMVLGCDSGCTYIYTLKDELKLVDYYN